jgi:dipeptidyl aminopeptidase/acylaminoacyl peptidase
MVTSRMTAGTGQLLGVLGFCVLATWSFDSRSESGKSHPNPTPSIDITRIPGPGTRRGITLDDMVSLREVHEPRQSPDGLHVAFLVKQAFQQCDCYRTALYLATSRGQSPAQKLDEEDYIANLQWSPDGKFISYLSSKAGSVQLWRLDPVTRRTTRLFVHTPNHDRSAAHVIGQSRYLPASGVLDYRWSPDGRRIAFVAEPPVDPSLGAAAAKEGFRYDDTTMQAWDLIVGDWASGHRSKQLWLYDVREKRERLIWSAPTEWSTTFPLLLWSPSGKKLAFLYSTNGQGGPDVMGIMDAATLMVSQEGTPGRNLSYTAGAAWSPDEHTIAYLANSPIGNSYTLAISGVIDHSRRELARDIKPGHSPWLAWDADHHRLLFLSEGIGQDRRQTGLYTLSEDGGVPLRLTALTGKIGECDGILTRKVACVWQAPSVLPHPALVSIEDGGIESLDEVNPELRSVDLGLVRELHWRNSYGDETNGFLILPSQQTPGVRVPLVVMGYGFSGEFAAYADSAMTTYPVQAFARDGIAVLLFNNPRYEPWEGANFERGSRAIGYGPLSSIQAIVKQLDAEGLIDVHRVGMMGHSLAGFWVQLAITQTNLFKAVEIHNGGTLSEPGTYWLAGSKQMRELQEHIMGGPPYGETLKNYLGYSMTLNANRIHVPVMMEYDAMEAVNAMEYYEALQHYRVPVDFFVYPNDGHVTERPEHRFMSLQRSLDWFEFWLLGKENEASSKPDQYTRWRQLKVLEEEKGGVDRPAQKGS